MSNVSVPWSGFINRKEIFRLPFLGQSKFQSRGRDLLIGKAAKGPEALGIFVSVPWSGFINRKAAKFRSPSQIYLCFSPVVGIY